ncbi:MAG: multidrug ABC transporter substrate-binding protein [Acidobacteria bacterium]|nr:MAG: multidrug ABC transporter substrate-binding protein [Acidobacteriota bacterium]
MQTSLTIVGMTIGVAAVLAMIAIGTGAEAAISDQIRAAGMNLIVVTAGNYKVKSTDDYGGGAVEPSAWHPKRGRTPFSFRLIAFHPEDDPMEKHDHPTARQRLGDSEAGLGSAATLTAADAQAVRGIRGVQYVAEGLHQNVHVVSGEKRWFTRLHGTDLQLPQIRRAWTLRDGRFFTAREQSRAEQVVVLGTVAAERLFGADNPIGRTVAIWKQPFRVVGVVTTTSWMVAPAAGDDQFDAVYMPFTTVHHLLNLAKLNDITITAASTGEVSRIMADVTKLLRARHGITDEKPDDFTVTTQARQALAKGGMPMTALLACIAGVSLLVGGIGIMNIMLLSVTERTREIGIRRSVGARARDVRAQFVVEAVALSLLGGLVGIALGFAASSSISQYLRWSTSISPAAVVLAAGIAASVGIFFGWYPARQAARLDPIQSLRYE